MIITTAKRIFLLILMLTFLIGSLFYSAARVQALELEELQNAESASMQRSVLRFTFKHYYDTLSFPSSTHRVYITDAVVFTNLMYYDLTYSEAVTIGFSTSGSYLADTVTDMSDCEAEVEYPCSDVFACGSIYEHHKDLGRISNALNIAHNGIERQFWVLWTDRPANTYCHANGGSHLLYTSHANVISHRPVIHVMSLTGDNSENEAAMSIILAHETAHSFGLDDVYNTANHSDDGHIDCIMDYLEYNDVVLNNVYQQMKLDPDGAFCDACKYAITFYIERDYYTD